MIPFILMLIYFQKSTVLCYLTFNYIVAMIVYFKAMKYYFPIVGKNGINNFHEKYPAYYRTDGHTIGIFRIFYGLVNYVWFKLVFGCTLAFLVYLSTKIFVGNQPTGKYWSKDQFMMTKKLSSIIIGALTLCFGVLCQKELVSNKETDEIIQQYFGPDFRAGEEYSTMVCNHISWADSLLMTSLYSCSLMGKATLRKVPFFGHLALIFQNLFIDRQSKEQRIHAINTIKERQEDILDKKCVPKICIFSEGTTTNGKNIINLKKGAFYALHPIKPIILKTDENGFSLGVAAFSMLLHMIISWTFEYIKIKVIELEAIKPTEFLFENFKHFGKDNTEIYMEAIRRVMAEVGGLGLAETVWEDKLNYMSEIKGKKIKNT